MGLTDFFADLYTAFSFPEVHAEAPEQKEEEGGDDESKPEEDGEEAGDKEGADGEEKEGGDDEGADEGEDKGGDAEEEEEEEEEEEPEDPKPKLEEECAHSAQCAPLKHHYDECVERVTANHDDPHKGKAKGEDCVEECEYPLLLEY
ncbi:hypothetical protein MMC13_000791 [Lambiella insularis]|nr:hypothetical protein [Lambiella insularis]